MATKKAPKTTVIRNQHAAVETALLEYGYTQEGDGEFVRYKSGPGSRPNDKWQRVDGGWLRFMREDGDWKPYHYQLKPEYQGDPDAVDEHGNPAPRSGISGLDQVNHPTFFEWVWPDAYVLHIYNTALQEAS